MPDDTNPSQWQAKRNVQAITWIETPKHSHHQQMDEAIGRWMALAEQAEKAFGLPRELLDEYLPPQPDQPHD